MNNEAIKGIPLFTDVPLQYSKYEVLLLSKKNTSVFVTSLLVKDEIELLSITSLQEHKLFEELCRFVFGKIILQDRQKHWNNDFENFMRQLTIADRDALLAGILLSTYEDQIEVELTCSLCGESSTVSVSLPEAMKIVPYDLRDKESVFELSATIALEAPTPMEFTLGVPSLADFRRALSYVDRMYQKTDTKRVAFMGLMFPLLVSTRSFKITELTSQQVVARTVESHRDMTDLVGFVSSMTNKARKTLFKELTKLFSTEIGVSLSINYDCTKCSQRNERQMGIIDFFFLTI